MTGTCIYCERATEPLAPCCGRELHRDQLVCVDADGCRDYILAELRAAEAEMEATR